MSRETHKFSLIRTHRDSSPARPSILTTIITAPVRDTPASDVGRRAAKAVSTGVVGVQKAASQPSDLDNNEANLIPLQSVLPRTNCRSPHSENRREAPSTMRKAS